MSNNIEGRVVVITGVSSRLGESTARLLSAQAGGIVQGARRVNRVQPLAVELTGVRRFGPEPPARNDPMRGQTLF